MKKTIIVVLCFSLIGCSAQNRMTRLRDKNENTVKTSFNGTIEEAKEQIRSIGKEMNLIEPMEVETENFMVLRSNMLKGALVSGLFSTAVAQPTRIGFMFDYDKEHNSTNISISEEIQWFITPRRFEIADNIKIRSLEKSNALASH